MSEVNQTIVVRVSRIITFRNRGNHDVCKSLEKQSLGNDRTDDVNEKPTQGHILSTIGGVSSEPGGLETFRKRSAWLIILMLTRDRKPWEGEKPEMFMKIE